MVRHLVFRCSECRSTTSVHATWSNGTPARVVCTSCQAAFDLGADVDRGRNDREYYDRVRRYAAESRIDLASAYSVVEGIMAPEKTRKLPATSPEIPRSPSQPVRALVLVGALVACVLLLSRYLGTSWTPELPAAARLERPASRPLAHSGSDRGEGAVDAAPIFYQVDAQSRLIKVSGSDARSVLAAVCNPEFQTRDLVPSALSAVDPAKPLERLGILRERGGAEGLRSVRIWLEPRTGRWTIGEGRKPVATEPLARLPEGAEPVL